MDDPWPNQPDYAEVHCLECGFGNITKLESNGDKLEVTFECLCRTRLGYKEHVVSFDSELGK